jgi:hypothetical protein
MDDIFGGPLAIEKEKKLGQHGSFLPTQGRGGSYGGRQASLSVVTKHKVCIFCLPDFIEKVGLSCLSCGSQSLFFVHVT